MAEREIIDTCRNYIRSVVEEYNLVKAYMFGSYAKGTNTADSDIDIALVLKNLGNPLDIQWELMKLTRKFAVAAYPARTTIDFRGLGNTLLTRTRGIPIFITFNVPIDFGLSWVSYEISNLTNQG